MSTCRNPCQEIICHIPSDYDYDLQSLPPRAPTYPNNQVTFSVSCAVGKHLLYTGTLPSWIRLVSASNQLIGNAGAFQGNTQAEANASAQAALDNFANASLAGGSLYCGVACITPTTFPTIALPPGSGSLDMALHPGTHTLWTPDAFGTNLYICSLNSNTLVHTMDFSAGFGVWQVLWDSVHDQMVALDNLGTVYFIDPVTYAIKFTFPAIRTNGVNGFPMAYDSIRGNILVCETDIPLLSIPSQFWIVAGDQSSVTNGSINAILGSPFYSPLTDAYYVSAVDVQAINKINSVTGAVTVTAISFPNANQWMYNGTWFDTLGFPLVFTKVGGVRSDIFKLDVVGESITDTISWSPFGHQNIQMMAENCNGYIYITDFSKVWQIDSTTLAVSCNVADYSSDGLCVDTVTGRTWVRLNESIISLGSCA